MKKIYILLCVAFCLTTFHLSAQDLADLETFEKAMKPGAQLTYDVTNKDKHYKLIVTLKKLGDEVSFSWKTTDPDNKTGNVTMTATATSAATALSNIFKAGDVTLDKETCLWASKAVTNSVSNTAQASLKVNGAADTVTVMGNTIGDFNFTVNDNVVVVPGSELQGGTDPKYTLDVLESAKFPLIFKLDIGWTAVLLEIKNP
jgi:hypothetical protein